MLEGLTMLPTISIFLAYCVTPLGVAGQNAGLVLSFLVFLTWVWRERNLAQKLNLMPLVAQQFTALWGLFTIPIAIATIRRGDPESAVRFIAGYFLSAIIVIGGLRYRSAYVQRKLLLNTACLIIGFMGLIAGSQMLMGWKLQGIEVVSQIKRAQGFYSHPLTLAYATLAIMPWSFARVMAKPSQWQSWCAAAGVFLILVSTQSVTVICVSAMIAGFLMIKLLPVRQMLLTIFAGAVIFMATLSVPNPIQQKFEMVLSGQRSDHETPYPDDRMAFWHAHWEMFKDAPWLGHGTGLESTDRRPYYELLGLGHLKRMYEAHNMFLQAAVEGGLVSLLSLVGFLAWWFMRIKSNMETERWYRYAMLSTPVAFALGGLTQNAIQDSEVRYTLLLACATSLWFSKDREYRTDT